MSHPHLFEREWLSICGERPQSGTYLQNSWHQVSDRKWPIEMIHGQDDPCTPVELVRHVTSEIYPDINLIEVPQAGYLLPLGHPDVLIDRVRAAHA